MIGGADARDREALAFEIGDFLNVWRDHQLIGKTIGVAENDVGAGAFEIGLDRRRRTALGNGDFAGQKRGIDDGCAADEDEIDVESVFLEQTGVERHP